VGVTAERHTVAVPGGRLCLVLHLPDARGPVPCVVACHGLGASKDSDKYVLLGAELPAAGFALARFDFRGCGESSGREEDTTIATRIQDVEAVLAHLARDPRLSGEVGLLGSSMGGFVALHVAARTTAAVAPVDGGHGRGARLPERGPSAVVTWNAPSDLHELANDEKRDGGGLGVSFFLELATHQYESTPVGVARHLVIQGEADDVVTVEHGTVLHARAAEPCDIVIIPGADHRLTNLDHRRRAVTASVAWFQRYLNGDGS
jgi:uncharacterized protein